MEPDLIVNIIQVAMGLSLAALVFFVAPGRTVNRLLAFVLIIEVVIVAGSRLFVWATAPIDRGLLGLSTFGLAIGPQAYLLFTASALDSPLIRPFQTFAGRLAVWVSMVFMGVLFFARPDLFLTFVEDRWGTYALAGPLFGPLNIVAGLLFLYVLIVASSAFRRASPGSIAKRSAGAFMVAFGVRDIILGPALLLAFNPATGDEYAALDGMIPADPIVWAAILYYPLVAYGILKWQLLGIDLRLKWALRRGLVPALVLMAFFVASETAQVILADRFQSAFVGILGAAILVLFFSPMQRFADKVAQQALPHVTNSSDYFAYRRLEVYRAAFEGAGRDGKVSAAERAILDRLRAKLSISAQDATLLERDAVAGQRARAA